MAEPLSPQSHMCLRTSPTTSLKEFHQSYERGCLLSYCPKTLDKTELTDLRLCNFFFPVGAST